MALVLTVVPQGVVSAIGLLALGRGLHLDLALLVLNLTKA